MDYYTIASVFIFIEENEFFSSTHANVFYDFLKSAMPRGFIILFILVLSIQ